MRCISVFLVILFLTSCDSVQKDENTTITKVNVSDTSVEGENNSEKTEIDLDLKNSETVYLTLDGADTVSEDSSIQISGQQISIKKSGNYEFSGNLSNGQIIIDTDDEKNVALTLNNVEITNLNGPTIFVENASQAVLILADGSKNILTDGENYIYDGTSNIYSKEDLVIMGEGELEVIGNYKGGIMTKDDLFIDSGNIKVTAAKDGITGRDYLLINSGNIEITSEGDSLKSTNGSSATILINGGNISINSGDDAINSGLDIEINGGNINIENAYEGLEGENIEINGGNINITTTDDGINVVGGDSDDKDFELAIKGGNIYINSNGDSIDSNNDVKMTGGFVTIQGTEQVGSSLDFDGKFSVSGGELIAIGNGNYAQSPSDSSKQNGFFINFDSTIEAGTIFSIKDSKDNEIISIDTVNSYEYVTGSSAGLETGETYYYFIDDEKIGKIEISDTITIIGEID